MASQRFEDMADDTIYMLGGVLETLGEDHDAADLRAASEQMAQLAHAPSRKAR